MDDLFKWIGGLILAVLSGGWVHTHRRISRVEDDVKDTKNVLAEKIDQGIREARDARKAVYGKIEDHRIEAKTDMREMKNDILKAIRGVK